VGAVSLGFQLQQEQTQRLIMTTQMKQAIELLQCSTLELNQLVGEWVDGNPCAEYEPIAHQLQEAWQSKVPSPDRQQPANRFSGSGTQRTYDQIIPNEITMIEQIDAQLRQQNAPDGVTHTARFLLGCLDENGYLRESQADVCMCLGINDALFDEALRLLQSCDPQGIGARNLAECLHLQLENVPGGMRSFVSSLINDYLQEVADGKLQTIAKKMGVRVSVVQAAVDALRRLNPKPGISVSTGSTEYVIPDVFVHRVGTGYVVMTNEHAQPHLVINHHYAGQLSQQPDAQTEAYLEKKLQAAQWLLRCLEQRRITLYRVGEAIVQYQHDFFDRGPLAMKPLTLHQIAESLHLHESTVSRATRGKYMLTPQGLFEMKYFFSAELQSDGGVTSAQVAKQEIRIRVEREDGQHPLSDDALAKYLSDCGIRISRRTVAKYREEMKIPPSWRRRRFID
jgi:RNA polymerase sigma-54 factor